MAHTASYGTKEDDAIINESVPKRRETNPRAQQKMKKFSNIHEIKPSGNQLNKRMLSSRNHVELNLCSRI